MKRTVACPHCGSLKLRRFEPSPLWWDVRYGNSPMPSHLTECEHCSNHFTDDALLRFMQTMPWIESDAPAFWRINGGVPAVVVYRAQQVPVTAR